MISRKQIAADYDVFWGERLEVSDDWTRLGMRPLRMQAVHLLAPFAGRILDVGCGNGLALAALSGKTSLAVGCDISLRALRDAEVHGDVVRADACQLPFPNETFQSVLMLDALEHVIDKPALVRECYRVLEARGKLALTTPLPKATGGHGDRRQPYDKPATYEEIKQMTSGLFRLQAARGIGWTPRGFSRLTWMLPTRMYATFPILLERSTEVLLFFEKG